MNSVKVESVRLYNSDLEQFNLHPTLSVESKTTWHGCKHTYCRKDNNSDKVFRAKLNYKGITLGFGHFIEPLTPQIIVEFVKKELKND